MSDLPITTSADARQSIAEIDKIVAAMKRLQEASEKAAKSGSKATDVAKESAQRLQKGGQAFAQTGGVAGSFGGKLAAVAGMGASGSGALAVAAAGAVALGVAFKSLENILARSARVFEERLQIERKFADARTRGLQALDESARRGLGSAGSTASLLSVDPSGGSISTLDSLASRFGIAQEEMRGAGAQVLRSVPSEGRANAINAMAQLIGGGMSPSEAAAQISQRPGAFSGTDAETQEIARQIFSSQNGGASLYAAQSAIDQNRLLRSNRENNAVQNQIAGIDIGNAERLGGSVSRESLGRARDPVAAELAAVGQEILRALAEQQRRAEEQTLIMRVIKDSFFAGGSELSKLRDQQKAFQQATP